MPRSIPSPKPRGKRPIPKNWPTSKPPGASSRDHYRQRAYIGCLDDAGFTELVSDLAKTGQRPTGDFWYRLTGLLWNGKVNTALTRLYQKLYETLRGIEFPTILEVPSQVVCADATHTPITDVRLLDKIFDEKSTVAVFCRKDNDTQNRQVMMSRPVISALLSELTLPIVPPDVSDRDGLLEVADVLDFPGARAPTQSQEEGVNDETVATQNASWAFRRGKLTRLFGLLTEEREITALCLAAGGDANVEAPGVVRQLLQNWLDVQKSGATLDSPPPPPLFLAITKADVLVKSMTAVVQSTDSPLGRKLKSIINRYSVGSKERHWMDNWGRDGDRFRDVHWVYNKQQYKIEETEQSLAVRKQALLQDGLVVQYVSEPEEKWEDLMKNGGVTLLARRIAQRLRATNKFRRLQAEMVLIARELSGRLKPLYRSGDEMKDQIAARKEAERLIKALRDRLKPNGPNILAELLQVLRVEPGPVTRVLEQLDRDAGKIDVNGEVISMEFDEFFRKLQELWSNSLDDRFGSEHLSRRLGIDPQAVLAARQHWRDLTRQQWMREALREVLDPYFESPLGPHRFARTMASAACWVWNRRMVELDEPVPEAPPPSRPPSLSPKTQPPYLWILDHWQRRLPDVYAKNVSVAGPPPPGNEQVGAILDDLYRLAGSQEVEAVNAAR